jgi:hypothetical protein
MRQSNSSNGYRAKDLAVLFSLAPKMASALLQITDLISERDKKIVESNPKIVPTSADDLLTEIFQLSEWARDGDGLALPTEL